MKGVKCICVTTSICSRAPALGPFWPPCWWYPTRKGALCFQPKAVVSFTPKMGVTSFARGGMIPFTAQCDSFTGPSTRHGDSKTCSRSIPSGKMERCSPWWTLSSPFSSPPSTFPELLRFSLCARRQLMIPAATSGNSTSDIYIFCYFRMHCLHSTVCFL